MANGANPVTLVSGLFNGVFSYLQQKRTQGQINAAFDAIDSVGQAVQSVTTGVVAVFYHQRDTWGAMGEDISAIGGAIQSIGYNQRELWHHLKYVLMPTTIQWQFDWIYINWVSPLRQHLHDVVYWQFGWNDWQAHLTYEVTNWAQRWFADGRAYRARWVYPQLQYLLNPGRFAYYNIQAILTEAVIYLEFGGHVEDRDGITRVVVRNAPRLWRHVEYAAVQFLLTEVGPGGYGASLPARPPGATEGPPPAPELWEPWLGDFQFPPRPPALPGIPEQDASYNG